MQIVICGYTVAERHTEKGNGAPPIATQAKIPRRFNPAGLLRETIGPTLAARGAIKLQPSLGVDEGLNSSKYVEPLLRRLVATRTVSGSKGLWQERRVRRSGETYTSQGGARFEDDCGAVRGYSWPDEQVVSSMVFEFLFHDRLCLLTANTKRDRDGLRQILQAEVAPVLREEQQQRLGLLVLCQRPGTTLESYCQAVAQRLFHGPPIEAGFIWELAP